MRNGVSEREPIMDNKTNAISEDGDADERR
jgi:hypothetical protein